MEAFLENTVYIEASDFDEHWRTRAATGATRIPLRVNFKQVDLLTTTATVHGEVQLFWSSDNGRVHHSQTVGRSWFTAEGKRHRCLKCPGCRRPRKRLFLVDTGTQDTGTSDHGTLAITAGYQFICKKCSGISTTSDTGKPGRSRAPINARRDGGHLGHGWSGRATRSRASRRGRQ
jgi:hypothetical protein